MIRAAALGIALVLWLWMSSCQGIHKNATDRPNVFRYNIPSALNSLDPAFAKDQAGTWIAGHLFNTLVSVDDNMTTIPSLAKYWDISADGLTYTFHLHTEIYFHEDLCFISRQEALVKASDVVFSFSRLMDPALASPGAWIFKDRTERIDPFNAPDDSTFILKLHNPFVPILGLLSMPYCSIISEKAALHYGENWRTHPIGSGPFSYKIWRENDVLILTKNKNYWEKDEKGLAYPYLDGVRISFNENKKNAFIDFTQGKLDFISGIDGSYKDEALEADGQLKIQLQDRAILLKSPYLNTEYLGFTLSSSQIPAVQKKEIRQAMNYAIDRSKMIRFLRNNRGLAASAGFVPCGLPSFDSTEVKGYHYNPEMARMLVSRAGYDIHNPIPEITLETTAPYQDLCVFMQNQWKAVGIPVKIALNPSSHLREKMLKGDCHFFRGSWIADYPDAQSYLDVFYSKNPAPPNYTRFSSARYDALYGRAILEIDEQKRYKLYREMDKIIVEEAPIIPLYYDEALRFISKEVSGLGVNPMNLLDLRKVRKREE